jgi:hypothetical protein
VTNVGVVQDKGHPEPWIVAMDGVPMRERVLDYGLRWGIESLFSDLKSRGFDIESSHLRQPERLGRLACVQVMIYISISVSLYIVRYLRSGF